MTDPTRITHQSDYKYDRSACKIQTDSFRFSPSGPITMMSLPVLLRGSVLRAWKSIDTTACRRVGAWRTTAGLAIGSSSLGYARGVAKWLVTPPWFLLRRLFLALSVARSELTYTISASASVIVLGKHCSRGTYSLRGQLRSRCTKRNLASRGAV